MLLLLSLSGFSGCGFFRKKPTPYFIDTQLTECREYEIISTDPLTFRYKTFHPLDHCNGFIALPPDQIEFVNEGN